jgi:hypothetical protein
MVFEQTCLVLIGRRSVQQETVIFGVESPLRGTGGPSMFGFRDLFQWERFVTPSIIKLFFWLAIAIIILFGLSGIASALQTMAASTSVGIFMFLGSLLGMTMGILFARIVAEFVLMVFRINEHLGAIRQRGEM